MLQYMKKVAGEHRRESSGKLDRGYLKKIGGYGTVSPVHPSASPGLREHQP